MVSPGNQEEPLLAYRAGPTHSLIPTAWLVEQWISEHLDSLSV